MPGDTYSASESLPLDKMIAAPLEGSIIGPVGSSFVIAEWTDEGGEFDEPRLVAPPHVHYHDDEAWYVLEGRLGFRLDGREVIAEAGAAVFVPAGVTHTFWNPGPEPARYLLIMSRNILELIEELHSAGRAREKESEVYCRHDSQLAGTDG